MSYDVAGLGNALVDALVRIPDDELLRSLNLERGLMHPVDHEAWEATYEAVRYLGVEVHSGGSCANTIATLGLMGLDARFCGQVGDDDFGRLYAERLTDACGGHALHVAQGRNTGKCLSLISTRDAERTLCTNLGAAVELPHIGEFAALIRESRVLHVTGYLFLGGPMAEAAWQALDVAKAAGIPISVDVADPFVVGAVTAEMWRAVKDYADIVFLNEEEAKTLTGLPAQEALAAVSEHASTVIVKLGGKGSLICHDGVCEDVGIHPTDCIDTTGAGDAYAAGYLYGWCKGWAPRRCGDLGARVASLAVGQIGAVVRDQTALQAAIDQVSGA